MEFAAGVSGFKLCLGSLPTPRRMGEMAAASSSPAEAAPLE